MMKLVSTSVNFHSKIGYFTFQLNRFVIFFSIRLDEIRADGRSSEQRIEQLEEKFLTVMLTIKC